MANLSRFAYIRLYEHPGYDPSCETELAGTRRPIVRGEPCVGPMDPEQRERLPQRIVYGAPQFIILQKALKSVDSQNAANGLRTVRKRVMHLAIQRPSSSFHFSIMPHSSAWI